MKWSIKVPFGDDMVYVVQYVDGTDQSYPLLFDSHSSAVDFALLFKDYPYVEVSPYEIDDERI